MLELTDPPTLFEEGNSFDAVSDVAVEGYSLMIKDPALEAKIYFTVDGSNPTNGSFQFDGHAIRITKTQTVIKAIAVVAGKGASKVVQAGPFKVQAAPAIFSFKTAGKLWPLASHVMSDTMNSASGGASSQGSEDVVVPPPLPPQSAEGGDPSVDSNVVECQVDGDCVPRVEIDMQVARPNERVHCTTDGSDPTEASPVCSDTGVGISVSKTGSVVKAIVAGSDVEPSQIQESAPIVVEYYPPLIEYSKQSSLTCACVCVCVCVCNIRHSSSRI